MNTGTITTPRMETNNNVHVPFINRVRQMRECSFCRQNGHKISSCNDERLLRFKDRLLGKKMEILSNPIMYQYPKRDFEFWLYRCVDSNLTKGFSMRFCGGRSRDNQITQIEKISQYIFDINDEETDYIPFNMDNSNANIEEIQNQITNYHNQTILADAFTLSLIFEYIQTLNKKDPNKFDFTIQLQEPNITEHIDCECPICYEGIQKENLVTFNCSHSHCFGCVEKLLESNKSDVLLCSLCRTEVNNMIITEGTLENKLEKYILEKNNH